MTADDGTVLYCTTVCPRPNWREHYIRAYLPTALYSFTSHHHPHLRPYSSFSLSQWKDCRVTASKVIDRRSGISMPRETSRANPYCHGHDDYRDHNDKYDNYDCRDGVFYFYVTVKNLFNVRRVPILLSQFVDYHLTSVFYDSRVSTTPTEFVSYFREIIRKSRLETGPSRKAFLLPVTGSGFASRSS